MKFLKPDSDGWRRWWRERRGDAAAMLAVVLFFVLIFGWAIFRGKFLIGGDVFFYTYPLRSVAWEMIRHGQLPLWTPLVLSGYPLLSMSQLGLGYPLTWGHLCLSGYRAEMIYILAPFLLAPAFTYAYARELGRNRIASLLAGLSYGYGGLMTNTFGMNGLMPNALMWLPLVLVAIERARTRRLAGCVAGVAAAYAMSVLTGLGQGFFFVGMVALAYSLFLVSDDDAGDWQRGRSLFAARRWRPFFACVCGMLIGAGLGAFQILETMRAARRSIRSSLGYDFFIEGAFTPRAAWHSFIAPLYHFIEVTTYVAPLAFLLALCAVGIALRRTRGKAETNARTRGDARIFFWAAVALVSLVLMLGDSTPLYRLLYRVPVFNLFRRPSRHAFEWTFASSVLAAYGWDALRLIVSPMMNVKEHGRAGRRKLIAAVFSLTLAAALGVLWCLDSYRLPYVGDAVPHAESAYLCWKIFFSLALVSALYFALRAVASRRLRAALLVCGVLLACFVEPYILVGHWWPGTVKTASRLTTPSRATRYLQQFSPTENRVYVRANSGVEEYSDAPRFDALNLTALYGVHNVAGYEQLMLERYSRALGGVDYDAVSPRRDVEPTLALFAPESHVLDLLNTTRVVTFSNLKATPEPVLDTERAKFDRGALDPARWQTEEEFDGVVILSNRRAQPRAWLVTRAESVDGEEALRRIRGDSEKDFDPRRTALVEVAADQLPALTGEELPPEAQARVMEYEPTRCAIETNAPTRTVLVVSEMIYPGWEATVDGMPAMIHTTNFLLRGVFVEAGRHRVEMRYRAPAARNGAFISALSLLTLVGLFVYARKSHRRDAEKKIEKSRI